VDPLRLVGPGTRRAVVGSSPNGGISDVPRRLHCRQLSAAAGRPDLAASFSVEELAQRSLGVCGHFPADWCVRYAGSTSGCGCDFRGAESVPSRTALRDYLATLPATAQIRVYACWEGDETEAIDDHLSAALDAIIADEPIIGERSLITFIPR
jgi:hypothetical protein